MNYAVSSVKSNRKKPSCHMTSHRDHGKRSLLTCTPYQTKTISFLLTISPTSGRSISYEILKQAHVFANRRLISPAMASLMWSSQTMARKELAEFTEMWGFEHWTSSPEHQQANSKAEAAVKAAKNIVRKIAHGGGDPYLAVLMWRKTPTE